MRAFSVRAAAFVCALACAALLQGCGAKPVENRSATGFYFDTVVNMAVYTDDSSVLDDAMALCADYEARLSKTVEGSDVWRINHAQGQWTQVDPETIDLLEQAVSWSEATDGAFDVTIAPVMALWNFTDGSKKLPDEAELSAAAALVDYRSIELDGDSVRVPEGVSIDLGGIAKGYISDKVAQRLRQNKVTSGYLNFGGNVVVIGGKPDGEAWNIGIQDPFAETGVSLLAVSVSDAAVVTSGNYERFFDLDGVRYHHILDANTGYPASSDVAGVTIICADAAKADAMSTSCFLLGSRAGLELVEATEGAEAVFITTDGQVLASSGAQDSIRYFD